MAGTIAALFRHPIKGFTPEKLGATRLEPGQALPGDRLYAVEDGPCGFDPAAPQFIPKGRFAVLAGMPRVARVRTAYDEEQGILTADAPGAVRIEADLRTADGKRNFEAWLTRVLDGASHGPLRLVDGEGHRFLDHPLGHVSILNLASLADMEARTGRTLDPIRLRANVHVAGWPAWVENEWTGREIALGGATARVFKPITRCAAPDVDPATARRDIEFTAELHRLYGHMLCGIYVQVETGGEIVVGDAVLAL
jgi:uncharacterized protein YcbX